jgi:hypothetical protein
MASPNFINIFQKALELCASFSMSITTLVTMNTKSKKGKTLLLKKIASFESRSSCFARPCDQKWTKVSNSLEQGATTLQQKSTPNMCIKTNKKLRDKMGCD